MTLGTGRCASLVAVALSLLLAAAAIARSQPAGASDPPPYKGLRYEEDYSYLQDLANRTDFFDPIKYVPFGGAEGRYLSLGGELRPFFEWFRNEEWGGIRGDDGYLLQRYMAHADLHWSKRTRLFAQVKSGIETGRASGPRPVDEDKLDLHQAFLDVTLAASSDFSLLLRAGRQELSYGHARLVNYREGPNVRRSFDGLKAIVHAGAWRADLFATRPVQTKPDFFDDTPDAERSFWGVYATRGLAAPVSLDLYYLGLTHEGASYDQGTADETRHTAGTRLWGQHGGWDYDAELVYQWGSFGERKVRAWAFAPVVGHTFRTLAWAPRLALSLDVHSGDQDPEDPALETYHPLFPKGAYFGLITPFGPSNHREIHCVFEAQPAKRLSTRADWLFFWRRSVRDGVYDVVGNLLRTGQQSDAALVGHSPGIEVVYSQGRHWTLTGNYSRFFAGEFLKETPPGEDISYVALWLTLKF